MPFRMRNHKENNLVVIYSSNTRKYATMIPEIILCSFDEFNVSVSSGNKRIQRCLERTKCSNWSQCCL